MIQEPDDLFNDAMSLLWRDGDGEVDSFAQAERRLTTLSQRLASTEQPVLLRCMSLTAQGEVTCVGQDFVCLKHHSGHTYARLAAITSVTGLAAQVIPPGADCLQRSLASALQRHLRERITCHLSNGTVLVGRLQHIYADHIQLVTLHSVHEQCSVNGFIARGDVAFVSVLFFAVDGISVLHEF